MNNVFKKASEIALDENYSITTDGDTGVRLVSRKVKLRPKVITENGKKIRTKEKEEYVAEDGWWFLTLGAAIEKYIDDSQKSTKTIEELLEVSKRLMEVVDDFRTKYKNWK